MRQFLLDPSGENECAEGFRLVKTQVEFLRQARGDDDLFVQHDSACRWAAEFARARGIQFKRLESPSQELVSACPSLDAAQAIVLLGRLGSLVGLSRPLKASEIASRLWPDANHWGGLPGAAHAFEWLLWLASHDLADEERAVVLAIGSHNAELVDEPLRSVYLELQPSAAWKLVLEWLDLLQSATVWPHLDALLPDWAVKRVDEELTASAVETKGRFFSDLLLHPPRTDILKHAARVCKTYLDTNPADLSEVLLVQLKPYLDYPEWVGLRSILPAQPVDEPPSDASELLTWFRTRYLPYRLWASARGGDADAEHVSKVGRKFGEQFLSVYVTAAAGGPGHKYLSWIMSAGIGQGTNVVTLLLVLDGLVFSDAEYLRGKIAENSSRLALDDLRVAIGPIPTITEYAKKSVRTGCAPKYAIEEALDEKPLTRGPEVLKALASAQPGQTVVWCLLEPDRTYHTSSDMQTAEIEVRSRLESIAKRLVAIANETSPDKRLRIVITTDHGRLLDKASRTIDAPDGSVQVHGRASWGDLVPPVPFDASGVIVSGDLAYLHQDPFYLPQPCAVVLTGDAFKTVDGKGGIEFFPHGGVYPEEVLVPWMEFTRDRDPIHPKVVLQGSAMAGAPGEAHLKIANHSKVRLQVARIEITPGVISADLQLEVEPLSSAELVLKLPSWPSKDALSKLSATLICMTPSGEHFEVEFSPSLEAEEIYQRVDILDDL